MMSRQGSGFGTGNTDMDDVRSLLGEQSNAGDKVIINVGGQKHETYIGTLKNIPDTRLYWITENGTQLPEFDPNTSEFFFDRHPGVFAQILNFYRTGKLHCPNDVCGPLFEDELAFWGIDELQVEPCCWLNYKQHREAQANLDPFNSRHESDNESVSDMDMSVYGLVADSIRNRNRSWWKKYQPRMWTMFEEPYSSIPAQIVAFITLFSIIVSVALFCLETLPTFNDPKSIEGQVLYILEAICVAWFTLEFVVRLVFCPNKLGFFKKPMNWIDFGAILPFYLTLVVRGSNIKTIVVLRVVRLIRVFRIFKLSRHSYGLQILGHTLRSSCSELFLLVFFLSIGVVIFSSVIYYAEKDHKGTHFTTIPHTFWWAVVTMTTLGYGDMVPVTWQGKIVGSLCAVSGVLMIALPVPVIVSNFSLYYSHAKARMKQPRRKRPVIFGAASALRVAQPVVSSENNPNVITQLIEEGMRVSNDDDSDDSNFASHRTPRNSGRRSPLHSIPNSPRIRTRNIFTSSPVITNTSPSPRGSMVSPPDQLKKGNLDVPFILEEIELQERRPNRNSSLTTERGSEVNAVTSSMDTSPLLLSTLATSSLHVSPLVTSSLPVSPLATSPAAKGNVPPLKSPLSLRNSDADSTSTCSEVKSPMADKMKSLPGKSLSSDSTGSPIGRRGRRGSLYIVGFTAKHWQNKALKKSRTTSKESSHESTRSNTNGSMESRQDSPLTVCDNCSQKSSARSSVAEGAARGGNEGSTRAASPRHRSSNDRNSNLHPRNHKELARVSSGTQTDDDAESIDKSKLRHSSISRGVGAVSVESTESTSRLSDDSLVVHGPQPRRGSSPLIRQHAVFTFDVPDTGLNGKAGGSKESRDRVRYPSGRHSTGAVKKKASSPPYPEDKHSRKKSKGRPTSLPSGYINPSYQREDDDSLTPATEDGSSTTKVLDSRNTDPLNLRTENDSKKSFQPYRKLVSTQGPDKHVTHDAAPCEKPRDITTHAHPRPVRTFSLPNDVTDRAMSYVNHAFKLPMTEMRNFYGLPYQGAPSDQFIHPMYDGRPTQTEPLLQRRQGPLLYLRMLPEAAHHEPYRENPIADYRPVSPFYGTITSPSGGVYVAAADDFFTSGQASGFTSAASSGFTSGPGSGYSSSDGRFIYPGYFSYSSSPSSVGAPSSADHVHSTRDCATSPMNFNDFLPSSPRGAADDLNIASTAGGAYLKPYSTIQRSRMRSWSAPGETKTSDHHDPRSRSRTAVDFELVPVSRATDEKGREYSVYAMPNHLERMMFIPPETAGGREGEERRLPDGDEQEHAQDDDVTVTSGDSRRDTPSPCSVINRNSAETTTGQQPEGGTSKSDPEFDRRMNEVDGESTCSSEMVCEGPVHISKSDPLLSGSHLDTGQAETLDTEHRHSFPTKKQVQPKLQRSDEHVIYNGHEPLQQRISDSLQVVTRLPSPDRRVTRSLPSPNRQRARAMFFGDSGISSADSGSMNSISHSLESEVERDFGEGVTGNSPLNPIRETEAENPCLLPVAPLPVSESGLPVESSAEDLSQHPENHSSKESGLPHYAVVSGSEPMVVHSSSESGRLLNSVSSRSGKADISKPVTTNNVSSSVHVIDILNNSDLYETSVV